MDLEQDGNWKIPVTTRLSSVDAADKLQVNRPAKDMGKGLLEAIRDGADSYGNALVLPETEETEVEGCVEVTTPRGHKLRLRGFIGPSL